MANFEKSLNIRTTEHLELFVEDGILLCIYKDIAMVDLAYAQACVRERLEYVRDKTYPSLFDITRIKQSTKDARDFLANEGNELVSASAILISSPMLQMTANFYIMVNKPINPTRMFTDRKSALEWLARFKD
ncbi:hypothetical protein C8N40_10653 [Pontibacter mucosus]|uniref:DUF7793 domain-containing protein n=1 Tax=Pontibacter mucosus TaxID=1649266 RepID=A0A2T5YG44_9BACT|nr:hypothetical protein [Pontibacter mucosus]PTX18254.1 hypothetical protein C8N40_10653 [Pontibacter mucosus]